MNEKFQKIVNRSLVGAALVLAIGGCIEAGAWWVFALFALVTAVGLYEVVRIFRLAGKKVHPALVYGTGGVIYVALGEFFLGFPWIGWTLLPIVGAWCVGMLLGAWQLRHEAAAAQNQADGLNQAVEPQAAPTAEPQTAADKAEAVNKASAFNIAWSLWAAVYVALPLSLLTLFSEFVMLWPFFIVIWTNDVFAYLVGCSFKAEKRHALAPRISPNKSWEGAVGGFVAALLAGALWSNSTIFFDIAAGMIFAAVVSVSSILGDLLESYYKRKASLKDSGTLLGGHGGVLDRFDSVLLAAPTVAVLLISLLLLIFI